MAHTTSARIRSLGLLASLLGCAAPGAGEYDEESTEDIIGSDLRATNVALRFDVMGYLCPGGAPTCPIGADKCICQTEYDHLNSVRVLPGGTVQGHYLVTGSDSRRDQIAAQGNRLAVNINELNEAWEEGGVARADAMMAWAERQFPGGVPQWFFLNEISRSRWLDTGDRGVRYRRYVADVARRLHVHHSRTVVVFSPFYRPGWLGTHHFPAGWQAIAANAYIGVENYISGKEIRANGFSEAACRNRYQQSITAYTRLGVPRNRLILTEHFGFTFADKNWGRTEIPIDQWIRAIQVRTRAAHSLPFAGYATYGWSSNRAHRPASEHLRAIDAYFRVGASRLALPDHSLREATLDEAGFSAAVELFPDPTDETDPDAVDLGGERAPAPDEPLPEPAPEDPIAGCDPPHSVDIGGTCVPSCGAAGGNLCSSGVDGACDAATLLTSYDCPVCCFVDPAAPAPAPACERRSCGRAYNDYCGGAPDGCGGTLSCGDTCGVGLNCTSAGLCRKALGEFCAGPGQCASSLCSWTTTPGSAARCCHDAGGWCDSDLKCCGGLSCRAGRCGG